MNGTQYGIIVLLLVGFLGVFGLTYAVLWYDVATTANPLEFYIFWQLNACLAIGLVLRLLWAASSAIIHR